MGELKEYKCPACGGSMEFDSKSQKMKCPYCDTEIDITEFEKGEGQGQETSQGTETSWTAKGTGQWESGETEGMKVYSCESCGGEIVADETTGATTCPFCGNRVVMKGQFEGDLKPDYIIPFKLDKNDAKAAYLKHLKRKKFMPKVFKDQNHIDEIKGVYVPFWLFDVNAYANVNYRGDKLRTWRVRNTEYTEHQVYAIDRAGNISFDRIPADGSSKMDDTLMESIEPYDFSEAVPFKPAFMAGYLADRYDVSLDENKNRVSERVRHSAEENFRKTIGNHYSNVSVQSSSVTISDSQYWYALYPVWILNTTWQEKKYIFAMNGQTGKMVGDLPLDKAAYTRWTLVAGIIFSAVIIAVHWLLL